MGRVMELAWFGGETLPMASKVSLRNPGTLDGENVIYKSYGVPDRSTPQIPPGLQNSREGP